MRQNSSALQLDLFVSPVLPENELDLPALFKHLNQKHWNGRLPEFRCEWSNRMITTWGMCYRRKKLIRISSFFKLRPLEEILALLSHEMIHIRYGGHGKKFHQELKRIGLAGDVQRSFPHLVSWTETLRRALRYIYECPRCGLQIQRRRKIHGYCSDCYDKGIRAKFRLKAT
jgi:SprT-like family protein